MKILAIVLIILGAIGLTVDFIHEWRLGPWNRRTWRERLNLPGFFLAPVSLALIWLGLALGLSTKLFHF